MAVPNPSPTDEPALPADEPLRPHPILPQHYADEPSRRVRVDGWFDAAARHYDRINRAMSFGTGAWYRRKALLRAHLEEGMSVLDVGCGTGVLAANAAEIVGPAGRVVGVDPSIGMLCEAKRQSGCMPIRGIAERLPVASDTFDLVCMGYALRHVSDLRATFAEFMRVLKPGGRLLILEVTPPRSKLGYHLLKLYLGKVVPAMTRLGTRSRDAQSLMSYFWETIDECVPPETIIAAIRHERFDLVNRHIVQSIFSEYTATKNGAAS